MAKTALNYFFIFSVFIHAPISFAASKVYTLGIVPQFEATTLHKEWLPLVRHLEKALDIKIKLNLYENFEDFEFDLFAGNLDFSYMNPGLMVQAHKTAQFEPLVASSTEKLSGLLVVPIDSTIKKVADLKNKTIAFPARTAFGASMLIQAYLKHVVKVPFKAIYLGNHENSYRAVVYGKASAAGGANKTLAKQTLEIQKKLRILFQTPEVASHPLAAYKGVTEDLKTRMTKELLNYSLTEEGGKLLANVGLEKPVAVTYERDYKKLEKL